MVWKEVVKVEGFQFSLSLRWRFWWSLAEGTWYGSMFLHHLSKLLIARLTRTFVVSIYLKEMSGDGIVREFFQSIILSYQKRHTQNSTVEDVCAVLTAAFLPVWPRCSFLFLVLLLASADSKITNQI